jgi:hypothetical protein
MLILNTAIVKKGRRHEINSSENRKQTQQHVCKYTKFDLNEQYNIVCIKNIMLF